ncbi:helix-turn-helix transcriptional regulator [Streptomyces sp. NPDC052015]|uniref:helix-turn-helix domain-containing protein n=1 Tax=Streptomyces sp. NPDC052015 TaxID=3154755 RepID=UPI00341EB7D9
MGRPEAPINYTIPELGKCAELLRAMRHSAGLTYTELADLTNYSPAHLKRAARGEWTSSDVVRAYALACCVTSDSDMDLITEVMALHFAASDMIKEAEQEARRSKVVPKPQYARDEADLSGAMRDAWARAGRPTSRFIETASRGQVPRSTAHTITKGRNVPTDVRQYVSFLAVCGISDDELGPWFRAWIKVRGVPSEVERRLARRWMRPAVGTQYFTAVLAGLKQRVTIDAARTLTPKQWSELRTAIDEVHEALAEINRETTDDVIRAKHGLAIIDGQHQVNSLKYAFIESIAA